MRKIMKLWNKLAYWLKGAIISTLLFSILLISILTLYFSENNHSDMVGLVFLMLGTPLLQITVIPTGFHENIVTRFLIETYFPYTLFLSSFLTWVIIGALIGLIVEKFKRRR